MKIKIYQVNGDRDPNRVMFASFDNLQKYQGSDQIDSGIYDCVFDGDVDCNTLEGVYEKFNTDHPEDYSWRSLSVSDIVEITEEGEEEKGFYFCDSFGFQKVDFNPEAEKKPTQDNMITALFVKPGCYPEVVKINRGLESLQRQVGGDIEQYSCFLDECCIICNEEGKVEGLPLNRAIYGEPEEFECDYYRLKKEFREAERENCHLEGYLVFTEDSFKEKYPLDARTYVISSNNKAFQDGMGGYSIYGSSLDGQDNCIRLDAYMKDEHGGPDGWKLERCYFMRHSKEMLDIIAGDFLIVAAPADSENYESLSPEQIKKYSERFRYPESFVRLNGKVIAIPFKPEPERNHKNDAR